MAETLGEECPTLMKRVGVPDKFGTSGKLPDILREYGLTAENVARQAKALCGR